MKFPSSIAALAILVFGIPLHSYCQPAPPPGPVPQLAVAGVKFGWARADGDNWLEAEVELEVRPGGKAVAGEFVDRVRTTLFLACEATNAKGEARTVFYRSSCEAITLEGGKAQIRFYLPPEVVRRDKLRADVKYYAVDLEAGGEPQPPARGAISPELKSADRVKNFRDKAGSEAAINEGLLVPQHLTPFAQDPQRRAPTVFRREAQR
jgi:hypothetical protein